MSANLENLENNSATNPQQGIGIPPAITSDMIESALKAIKECQTRHNTTSCIFCKDMVDCTQKDEFGEKTQENLTNKQEALMHCQNSKGFSSCLKCPEILECKVRNDYVSAVYLSMNKGNGGSFEF
ncbi:hypothetical protein [Helicobacter sp. MIT 05-5294]|uniref:hypothetical protein n=1 Tax=Helicobacter sp. MIT 05-5294 TaxID=1548150 RepID=UPI000AFF0335|nr:hypothetical protein [Helicobacter sp. MIT 05-5294]